MAYSLDTFSNVVYNFYLLQVMYENIFFEISIFINFFFSF